MFSHLQTLKILKRVPSRLASLTVTALLGGTLVAQGQTAPFACTKGVSYLFLNNVTDAFLLDIGTGKVTQQTSGGLVASPNQQLNSFGYNQKDNLIYGQRNGTSQIVRVDANFVTTALTVAGLDNTNNDDIMNAVVGDVDANGIMYITRGGSVGGGLTNNGTTGNTIFNIYAINLTQQQLQATLLPVKPGLTFINDWAVSPIDGNLYAIYSTISANTPSKLTLYRFTTTGSTAGTRTDLGEVTAGAPVVSGGTDHAIVAANYGSCFMDQAGDFYVVANTSGYVYRIKSPHKLAANSGTAANYVSAAISNQNNVDGARCPTTAVATSGPLPVQLTDFTASLAPNRAVRLAWETASELNNDHFEVQRSADGRVFTAVGQVRGHGSAVQANSYSFTDAAPGGATTYYYRLRQVDTDGRFDFSPVRAVTLAAGSSPVQVAVAPNPSPTGSLRVQVQYAGTAPATATLTLHSLLGQPVRSQAVTLQPGANNLRLDAAVAPGAYWLSVNGAGSPGRQGVRVLLTE